VSFLVENGGPTGRVRLSDDPKPRTGQSKGAGELVCELLSRIVAMIKRRDSLDE
jgi:hypothetical protein